MSDASKEPKSKIEDLPQAKQDELSEDQPDDEVEGMIFSASGTLKTQTKPASNVPPGQKDVVFDVDDHMPLTF